MMDKSKMTMFLLEVRIKDLSVIPHPFPDNWEDYMKIIPNVKIPPSSCLLGQGKCKANAMLIQRYFGGNIYGGYVFFDEDIHKYVRHYINLINNTFYDFTYLQYVDRTYLGADVTDFLSNTDKIEADRLDNNFKKLNIYKNILNYMKGEL